MEAGLCAQLVNSEELRQIIDDAHSSVFGVPFKEKVRPKDASSDLLEVPTWIRDGKSIL